RFLQDHSDEAVVLRQIASSSQRFICSPTISNRISSIVITLTPSSLPLRHWFLWNTFAGRATLAINCDDQMLMTVEGRSYDDFSEAFVTEIEPFTIHVCSTDFRAV
ncbi:hypothetical protein Tcan_17477, partial [Toxocara canis]